MLAFKQNDDLDHLRFDYDDDHKVLLAQDRFLRTLWDGASITDYPVYGALFFINRATGVTVRHQSNWHRLGFGIREYLPHQFG